MEDLVHSTSDRRKRFIETWIPWVTFVRSEKGKRLLGRSEVLASTGARSIDRYPALNGPVGRMMLFIISVIFLFVFGLLLMGSEKGGGGLKIGKRKDGRKKEIGELKCLKYIKGGTKLRKRYG